MGHCLSRLVHRSRFENRRRGYLHEPLKAKRIQDSLELAKIPINELDLNTSDPKDIWEGKDMESNVQQDRGANVTHDQSVRGESPVSQHDLPSMNSEMEQEEESWLSGFISSIVRPLSRRQSE